MTDVERIIELARREVGVTETPKGSNCVKYNTAYYGGNVSGSELPWCVVFIWWLFGQLGIQNEFCGGAKTAYCPFVVNYAKNSGAWITDPSKFKAGDCLLFDWNRDGIADHIGLLISWNGSSGQTIEGNAGDQVSLCTRSVGQIMGAYRPAYRNTENPSQTPTAPVNVPSADIDDDPNEYTVKQGDSLWLIATLHGTTWQELARINNIAPPYIIYAGQTLKLRETPVVPVSPTVPIKPAKPSYTDEIYVARPHDTLWSIAQEKLGNGWRWPKLAEANNILPPYLIKAGQTLRIPKGGD